MDEQKLLQALGLSEPETQVYLSLLSTGPASIRSMATHSGVNRGTTFEALKRLSTIGLVSFNRKGERRKFFAENPEVIYELIAEKKRELIKTAHKAEKIVPALAAQSKRRQAQPIARFYEDDEGVAAMLRDV